MRYSSRTFFGQLGCKTSIQPLTCHDINMYVIRFFIRILRLNLEEMVMRIKLGTVLLILSLMVILIVAIYGKERLNHTVMNVKTTEVKSLIAKHKNSNSLVLLDVREPDEFAGGHLPGAVLIPLGQLEQHISELPFDKTILIICRSGRRSRVAANTLIESGFEKVLNYQGGMLSWDGDLEY